MEQLEPRRVEALAAVQVRQADGGEDHMAVLTSIGTVLTWGRACHGRLGHSAPGQADLSAAAGSSSSRDPPTHSARPVTALDPLSGVRVRVRGSAATPDAASAAGAAGAARTRPVAVPGVTGASQVVCGGAH